MDSAEKLPKTTTCPLCGATMTLGVWSIAEIPIPPGRCRGDMINDTAWFCSPIDGNAGCCAVLLPGLRRLAVNEEQKHG